MHYKANESVKY